MEKGVPSWAVAPSEQDQLHLSIRNDDGTVRTEIDKRPGYLLGRHRDCDIVCDHKTCSRVHACIAHHADGRVIVIDMKSVHGTFVDGRELETGGQAELLPGKTQLKLGACEWLFSLENGPSDSRGDAAEQAEAIRGRDAAGFSGREGQQDEDRAWKEHERHHRPRGSEHSRSSKRSRHDSDRRGDRHSRRSKGRDADRDYREMERERPRDSGDDSYGDAIGGRSRDRGGSGFEQQGRVPAADPASIVRSMGGAPAGFRPMTGLEQKKKLLWGNKSAASPKSDAERVFGANRWDAAQFQSEAEKQKFIKLMGVHNQNPAGEAHAGNAAEREAMSATEQNRVLSNVETHFMQGLRRADGRKVGLGL